MNYYFTQTVFSLTDADQDFLAALRAIGPQITELQCEDHSHMRLPDNTSVMFPPRFLSTFSNVMILSLAVSDEVPARGRSLRFAQLEELKIRLDTSHKVDAQLADISSWIIPRLVRVGIRYTFVPKGVLSSSSCLTTFLELHGKNIQELAIQSPTIWSRVGGSIDEDDVYKHIAYTTENFVTCCPSLQYLCCLSWCKQSLFETLLARQPPVLLDMWGTSYEIPVRPISGTFYPNVRVIDEALSHLPNLPRCLLHPRLSEVSQVPVIHHVYRMHIVETTWALFTLGAPEWSEERLKQDLGEDIFKHIKIERWISGLPEFDFDERMNYAYLAIGDTDSDSEDSDFVPSEMEDTRSNDSESDADQEDRLFENAFELDDYDYVESQDGEFSEGTDEEDWSSSEDSLVEEEVLSMFLDHVNSDIGCIAYI
ncbi:hypothetical protein EIP91_011288 [Steccherinum ochraceum]|uniref:Uncharacterized protein n=1 Tax=Steccherinum ochraceum TaxID=92696 RepID=A0A4R0R7M0_9APHY|nr:hypothetical protein EIP91_011288 [Steccherinum ochraceum]